MRIPSSPDHTGLDLGGGSRRASSRHPDYYSLDIALSWGEILGDYPGGILGGIPVYAGTILGQMAAQILAIYLP